VATDVGGVSDVVENGVTGLLVPPGDEKSAARSVLRLLNDPDMRLSLGAEGEKRAQLFSARAMVDKIDALYRERIRLQCS